MPRWTKAALAVNAAVVILFFPFPWRCGRIGGHHDHHHHPVDLFSWTRTPPPLLTAHSTDFWVFFPLCCKWREMAAVASLGTNSVSCNELSTPRPFFVFCIWREGNRKTKAGSEPSRERELGNELANWLRANTICKNRERARRALRTGEFFRSRTLRRRIERLIFQEFCRDFRGALSKNSLKFLEPTSTGFFLRMRVRVN